MVLIDWYQTISKSILMWTVHSWDIYIPDFMSNTEFAHRWPGGYLSMKMPSYQFIGNSHIWKHFLNLEKGPRVQVMVILSDQLQH